MLQRVAMAAGKSKLMLPMPLWLMKIGATLFDWLPFYPVTRDQLIMLEEGNTGPSEVLEKLIVRQARSFSVAELQYLAR
jgi:NADH dehydrogenase